MITLGDILCISFINDNTEFIIFAEKSIIFQCKYTEMDNALFSKSVIAFSYKTYKNQIKVAIL